MTPSITSLCNTLRKLEIDKTRSIIFTVALTLIVLSTTGSYSHLFPENAEPMFATSLESVAADSMESATDSLMTFAMADVKEEIQLRPYQLPLIPASSIDAETLWLARCILSETNRPEEQELIAWVVRNRVESGYRGKDSYRRVVLDPYQFSAFNSDAPKSSYYRSLSPSHNQEGWQRALTIAYYVRHARPHYRPFSTQTLHFYSEQSMVGRKKPAWAYGSKPIQTPERYALDERRFRFYEGIS